MDPINVTGIKELNDIEKQAVNKMANEYYTKIQRLVSNAVSLLIHVKVYKKEGKRKKYSLKLKVVAPTRIFESNSHEWDLNKALHQLFDAMIKELKKAFSRKESYHKSHT
jgi:ribosome-associated translation inhibitor RaiA